MRVKQVMNVGGQEGRVERRETRMCQQTNEAEQREEKTKNQLERVMGGGNDGMDWCAKRTRMRGLSHALGKYKGVWVRGCGDGRWSGGGTKKDKAETG